MAKEKIRYLVDEQGRKESVVLPIKEYMELLADLSDLAIIAERTDEPSQALAAVRKRLEEKWQNTGLK